LFSKERKWRLFFNIKLLNAEVLCGSSNRLIRKQRAELSLPLLNEVKEEAKVVLSCKAD